MFFSGCSPPDNRMWRSLADRARRHGDGHSRRCRPVNPASRREAGSGDGEPQGNQPCRPPANPVELPGRACLGFHHLELLASSITRDGTRISGSNEELIAQAGPIGLGAVRFYIEGTVSGSTLLLSIRAEPPEFGHREQWTATLRSEGGVGVVEGQSSGSFTLNECVANWSGEPFVAQIVAWGVSVPPPSPSTAPICVPAPSNPAPAAGVPLTFNVSNVVAGATYTWSVTPAGGTPSAGSGPSFTASFAGPPVGGAPVTYSVTPSIPGVVVGTACTVTVPPPSSLFPGAGAVVVNEFRTRGPAGASDEFVEIRNDTGSGINIGGWRIDISSGSGSVETRYVFPSGLVIGPGCHYLLANAGAGGYTGAVSADATYSAEIADDGGIAVRRPDGTIVDAVGMSTGSAFKEGEPLASFGGANTDRSYKRLIDTNYNLFDFAMSAPSSPINLAGSCSVR
jgi:hypothetical protein